MNNSTKKEKWWLYSIFFLIGILSFPLSLFVGGILEGIFQLLFPFVICSILFSMVLYIFKERSFRYALKVFVISLIASVSIFMGGYLGAGLLIPAGLFLPLYPLAFLLILSAIGLIAFKNRPLASFTVKAFTISFFTIFLIVGAWFMWGAIEHEYAKHIHIHKVDGMPGEYVNITEQELEEYPALKKAISGQDCERFSADRWGCTVHPDEWRRTREFISKKTGYVYLFSMDRKLEEDLNKGIITIELRNAFESEGYSLPENLFIRKLELKRWWMEDEKGKNFYYIWKEDDGLNVYRDRFYDPIRFIKVGENYYEVLFAQA
ncbi:MAG: hypothetical protein Q8M95_12385 [Candidatus Methanoperedens sp.]|nr:hypothetical protein [Candidatus Methanoperedens sp.]